MKNIIKLTEGSSAMKIDALAKSKIANGEYIYNLAAGDPNTPVPNMLIGGLMSVCKNGTHNYTSAQGDPELRKLIHKNPDEVIISNGAKQLIYMALMAICNPGDKVIIVGPCWSSYIEICKILKLDYILVICNNSYLYDVDIFTIEEKMNDGISAVLFNNPVNPTGKTYSKIFTDRLHKICIKYNCWLISDEIYSGLIYDDNTLFESLKGKENVIYINGYSKVYSITGWRFGYAIADAAVIQNMTAIQGQISGPPNTIVQQAVKHGFDYIIPTDKNIFKERRDILCQDNSFFLKHCPQAGFYFYLPISGDSNELCERFLRDYNIALTPGDDYGVPHTIRLSFASIDAEDLKQIKPILDTIS